MVVNPNQRNCSTCGTKVVRQGKDNTTGKNKIQVTVSLIKRKPMCAECINFIQATK